MRSLLIFLTLSLSIAAQSISLGVDTLVDVLHMPYDQYPTNTSIVNLTDEEIIVDSFSLGTIHRVQWNVGNPGDAYVLAPYPDSADLNIYEMSVGASIYGTSVAIDFHKKENDTVLSTWGPGVLAPNDTNSLKIYIPTGKDIDNLPFEYSKCVAFFLLDMHLHLSDGSSKTIYLGGLWRFPYSDTSISGFNNENPNKGTPSMQYNNNTRRCSATLFNVNGQAIKNYPYVSITDIIKDDISTGIYFLKPKNSGYIHRIIIK